jgi:hypothetical protein
MNPNCCCSCHKVDIIAIRIPEKLLKARDRYEALLMADRIMKHNNLDKYHIKVQENWSSFLIYYEKIVDLSSIKIKKFDNDILLYLKY